MKRTAMGTGLAIMVMTALAFAQATTQSQPQSDQPQSDTSRPQGDSSMAAPPTQTHTGMTHPPGTAGSKMSADELRTQLKQAGISDEKATQMEYVMLAQVHPFDPAHVLAIKEKLNLTDDQVNRLHAVAKRGMDEARSILNDDQRRTIQQIRPMTVAEATRELPPSVQRQMMASAGGHTTGMPSQSMTPGTSSPEE